MSKWAKLVEQARRNRNNVRFEQLCALVEPMGYTLERQRRSHRHYRRAGSPPINLQEASGGQAKPYQVAQVLAILDELGIEVG